MDSNKKKYIVNNLKWPITHFEYISNYFSLIFPFIFIYAGFSKYDKDATSLGLIIFAVIVLIYIIFRIESERKFKELNFSKDLSTNEIGKLLEINGWTLMANSNTSGIIKLNTSTSFLDQGQTITIIRVTKEKILINTQPNGRAVFTFFKDLLNYNQIKEVLTK
jgi:hypothetical protein